MDARDAEHPEQPLRGEWLYRKGELVLGPVPGAKLLDKLYAGDINGQTEVALVGEDFERITQVDALTGEPRQEELAQMLGGVSEATLRSAEEILQTAHQQEQSIGNG